MLLKVFHIKLIVSQNRHKYKFEVVYEAGVIAVLASITQTPWGGSTVKFSPSQIIINALNPRTRGVVLIFHDSGVAGRDVFI